MEFLNKTCEFYSHIGGVKNWDHVGGLVDVIQDAFHFVKKKSLLNFKQYLGKFLYS